MLFSNIFDILGSKYCSAQNTRETNVAMYYSTCRCNTKSLHTHTHTHTHACTHTHNFQRGTHKWGRNVAAKCSPLLLVCCTVCLQCFSRLAYPKILLSVLRTACVRVFRFLSGFFGVGGGLDARPISQSKKSVKGQFFYHSSCKNSV